MKFMFAFAFEFEFMFLFACEFDFDFDFDFEFKFGPERRMQKFEIPTHKMIIASTFELAGGR